MSSAQLQLFCLRINSKYNKPNSKCITGSPEIKKQDNCQIHYELNQLNISIQKRLIGKW